MSRYTWSIVILSVAAFLLAFVVGYRIASGTGTADARVHTVTEQHYTTVVREPTVKTITKNRTYPTREITHWRTTETTLPNTGP